MRKYLTIVLKNPQRGLLIEQINNLLIENLYIHIIAVMDSQHAFADVSTRSALASNIEIQPVYLGENATLGLCLFSSQLAKYKKTLIWSIEVPILLADILTFCELDCTKTVYGLSGWKLREPTFLQHAVRISDVTENETMSIVGDDMLLFSQDFLNFKYRGIKGRSDAQLAFEISKEVAQNVGEIICPVVRGTYPMKVRGWSKSDFISYSHLFLNNAPLRKKWREINLSILPASKQGLHFQRILDDKQYSILVTGCQRSGTTWFNTLLGDKFQGILSLSENESFDYLLDGYCFAQDLNGFIWSLQTTFIVSERESYRKLDEKTLIFFLLRNPYSVCWSLLYHFNLLEIVWSYRVQRMEAETKDLFGGPTNLEKAIQLYLDSLATLNALRQGESNFAVVDFEDLVGNPNAVMAEVSNNLTRWAKILPDKKFETDAGTKFDFLENKGSLQNQKGLSRFEREEITRFCLRPYLQAKEMVNDESNR